MTKEAPAGTWLVDDEGRRRRFLRGMLVHDLMQRGLDFDTAYAVAGAARERVRAVGEVSVGKLEAIVAEVLPDGVELAAHSAYAPVLQVSYRGDAQPFSRGVLAQSLMAAGVDQDAAYDLVLEIQQQLVAQQTLRVDNRDLALLVGELLEQRAGRKVAGRYRLLRRVSALPKPLVIYIGGASGTGKSTLALQLAPLLRIHQINSTDTIRQVMRMVFSQAMLPSLHRSSFEVEAAAAATHSEPVAEDPDALRQALEIQATQVAVGVRAVVDRSVAEGLSVFVEGVHLLPGLVPFGDLEGSAYQLMMVLSTEDEEVHRSHMLSRTSPERPSQRYLESLTAIRVQQELLLDRADEHDVEVLDTSERQDSSGLALELLLGQIESKVPWLSEVGGAGEHQHTPTLLLIVDGLPDQQLRSLGGRTPLEAAATPTLDRLAREGVVGVADPIAPDVVPDTAAGTLAIFGQAPDVMQRGPIEAVGAGLKLRSGDVALRGNLATESGGMVVDRRAGRVREESKELAKLLDRLDLGSWSRRGYRVRVRASTDHRLAIALRGEGLSSAIVGSDPGDAGLPSPALVPRALRAGDRDAERSAELLTCFEERAAELLADHPLNRERHASGAAVANRVLTRGAGRLHDLMPLAPLGVPLRLACASGDRTVLGIASLLGASNLKRRSMTAGPDTDLEAKFAAALDALDDHELVVVHVKGADLAAHDRRPDLKLAFLERLDRELGAFLDASAGPIRVAVASDHQTSSETGNHGPDPVPVLIWGDGVEADRTSAFSEAKALAGSLGRFPLRQLVERLFAPQVSAGVNSV